MIRFRQMLLIDDDHAVNFIHKIMIEKSDLCNNVLTVLTGIEALEYLIKLEDPDQAPDIILLDVNMPEMTGWEFLEEYAKLDSKIHEKVKIYMLSSSQREEDVEMAKQNDNVLGFFNKPLNIDVLQSTFAE